MLIAMLSLPRGDDTTMKKNEVVLIEVKAGSASRARSLGRYCCKFSQEKSVMTSLDHGRDNVLPL